MVFVVVSPGPTTLPAPPPCTPITSKLCSIWPVSFITKVTEPHGNVAGESVYEYSNMLTVTVVARGLAQGARFVNDPVWPPPTAVPPPAADATFTPIPTTP